MDVQVLASNSDITQWDSSLDAHGMLVADETYQRWSGDSTDPNNEPEAVTYTTKSFEMRLYFIQIHGGPGGREIISGGWGKRLRREVSS